MSEANLLLGAYQAYLKNHNMLFDPVQVEVLAEFSRVKQDLEQQPKRPWWNFFGASTTSVKGLYLWGGVGRGKTFLMDLFYENVAITEKKRLHFHRFMHWVHSELTQRQGEKNPLNSIAKQFAKDVKLVCFDEFFVSDITDAMLLAGLFQALFAEGITLVATSNVEPVNLYRNGLQRERFLPTISLIEKHCKVSYFDSKQDHRLRQLEQAELYYWPDDKGNRERFEQSFHQLAPEEALVNTTMTIEGRPIPVERLASDVAWFTFAALCGGPRSQVDYIELSRLLHTVFISDVPQMDASNEDEARRFIALIDEFYERKVKLILAAEVSIEQLYQGDRLVFEFERTVSRIIEMQSVAYLARAHLP